MDSMWAVNMYTFLILLPEEQKLNFLSEETLMYLIYVCPVKPKQVDRNGSCALYVIFQSFLNCFGILI